LTGRFHSTLAPSFSDTSDARRDLLEEASDTQHDRNEKACSDGHAEHTNAAPARGPLHPATADVAPSAFASMGGPRARETLGL
jgi:hypothetical protein